jgi:hypothetical protein
VALLLRGTGGTRFVERDDEGKLWLPPYGAWWLVEHN